MVLGLQGHGIKILFVFKAEHRTNSSTATTSAGKVIREWLRCSQRIERRLMMIRTSMDVQYWQAPCCILPVCANHVSSLQQFVPYQTFFFPDRNISQRKRLARDRWMPSRRAWSQASRLLAAGPCGVRARRPAPAQAGHARTWRGKGRPARRSCESHSTASACWRTW